MALQTTDARRSLASLVAWVAVCTLAAPAMAQFGGDGGSEEEPRKSSRFNPLKDVIVSTIAPNTWDEVGGEGSISIVDTWGVAVVSQTQDVHDQIEALLSTIRRVRQQQDQKETVTAEETKPSSIYRTVDDERRKQIKSALDSDTKIHFLDEPLEDAVVFIEQHHGIQIEVDQRALEESGLDVTVPLNKQLSGISLRSALRLLLRDLGLTYVIENEVLQITTPEEAETRLITVVYPVKDLAASPE